MENIFKVASLLDNADLELLLNKLFLHLALAHDIIFNSVNKSNLLYKFALALCQTNPITGEPVFPMMPFGLVEYRILHLDSHCMVT